MNERSGFHVRLIRGKKFVDEVFDNLIRPRVVVPFNFQQRMALARVARISLESSARHRLLHRCAKGRQSSMSLMHVAQMMAIAAAALCLSLPGNATEVKKLIAFAPELSLREDLVFGGTEAGEAIGEIADIALDSSENLYILDSGFKKIHKFSASGERMLAFGAEGEGPGDLQGPIALAIGPDDVVYTAGMGAFVSAFDSSGKPLWSHRRAKDTVGAPAYSIAVDSAGFIYVCSPNFKTQKIISKYESKAFTLVAEFCDTYAVGADVDTREERSFAGGRIHVEGADKIWFSQLYPPAVKVLDLNGMLLRDCATANWDTVKAGIFVKDGRTILVPPSVFGDNAIPLTSSTYLVSTVHRPAEGPVDLSNVTVALDVYEGNCRRVKSTQRNGLFLPRCVDSQRRLYVVEYRTLDGADVPVVVRYTLN
ncbi:MAG: hypothetical protein IPJ24_15935 [bacterium]|nr:hypothetical protein [bacterium]